MKLSKLLNRLLLLAVLSIPNVSLAHPADNICSSFLGNPKYAVHEANGRIGGQFLANGTEACIKPASNDSFYEDYELYEGFRVYWHRRRNGVKFRNLIIECVARKGRSDLLSTMDGMFNSNDNIYGLLADYWGVLPATPIKDKYVEYLAGDITRARLVQFIENSKLAARNGNIFVLAWYRHCEANL